VNAMRRRSVVHTARATERREREDAALRLRDQIPRLLSLRMTFRDVPVQGVETALPYVRPIVVETAPAHFEVPCMLPQCGGRHDLTAAVMAALEASRTSFHGESDCEDGSVEGVPCERTLEYTCHATYRRASKRVER